MSKKKTRKKAIEELDKMLFILSRQSLAKNGNSECIVEGQFYSRN